MSKRREQARRTTFGARFHAAPIERKAEETVTACVAKLGLGYAPSPIPVDRWIEGAMGIDFGIEDLSHLGPDVLGAAFIAERRMLISDRALRSEARFRFTCAHELGHFVLHGGLAVAFRDTADEPVGRDLHEREADRFAAAFLMPMPAVVPVILDLSHAAGVDPLELRREVLAGGLRSAAWVREMLGPATQSQFQVSYAAAVFRLNEVLRPEIGPFMSAVTLPWGLKTI